MEADKVAAENGSIQKTRESNGLLKGKRAIIYGAGGAVGRAVAITFAREGAEVFLAGRTVSSLEAVSQEILRAGGIAEVSRVDALVPKEVEGQIKSIVEKAGKLDISFNLISAAVGMGRTLTQLPEGRFIPLAFTVLESNYITATAAARQMEKQGSGVILGLSATSAKITVPNTGGFSIGSASIELLCRQLAIEAGPKGVRVACIRTGGTPDNPTLHEAYTELARVNGTTKDEVVKSFAEQTALKRLPLLQEVANAAVLIASGYATAITGTVIDASCGDVG